MLLVGEVLAVRDGLELAVLGRQPHRDHALDELLRAPPVLDEIGDGDHLHAVVLAVADEVGYAGHRPVLVHDLADDARGIQAGEPGEVDGRLRLAGPLQHAAGLRAEREDVARLDEVVRHRAGVDRDLDRACAIVGGDARRDSLARLDRDRERGPEGRLVVVGHRPQLQLVAALGRETEADQARGRASP